MYRDEALRKESVQFKNRPFTFRLSDRKVEARRTHPGRTPIAKACDFCGSVKLLGEANSRSLAKSGRAFCDEDCACGWKSIYYRLEQYEHNERLRVTGKARRAKVKAEIEQRAKDRLAKRLARPINKKTPGYVTCTLCHKTVWVEQHSQKKFCSVKCGRKARRNTEGYKSKRRESKRNREHIKRSKGVGDRITIPELMKKHKRRCVNCQTICVRPEGYNWENEANIDHVLPIASGGLHIWSNVQLLCRRCNMAKGAKVTQGAQLMLDLRFK